MTLRDIWESRGLTMTQVAGQARISMPTLYKILRKEPIKERFIRKVCNVLRITLEQYSQLEPERQSDG